MRRCEGRSYQEQTYHNERLLGQLSRRLAHEHVAVLRKSRCEFRRVSSCSASFTRLSLSRRNSGAPGGTTYEKPEGIRVLSILSSVPIIYRNGLREGTAVDV